MSAREYDVVIAGSGAGGGTVADRLIPLVEKGLKVAILEAGPHYTHEYFTQREIEMTGMYWYGGAWPTKNGTITLAAGKAVGGSTVMYTGVTFRLPEEVVEDWAVEGLTAGDLRPRFEKIEKEINVIEPGPDMVNDNNRLFKEGCDKLGWPVEKIRLNLKDCEQMGYCNLGCSTRSKQGTLEVQLPKALAAGVDLVPNCLVKTVSADGNGGGIVTAEISPPAPGTKAGPEPDPWPPGETAIKARRVVLAGGCPGTSGILMRSGFGEEFRALGRYITMHPALTVYGIHPEEIKNYRGFPKTYYTPKFSESRHYYIETAFYYPFVSTKHLGLWGRDLKEAMKAYNRFMTQIILNHDPAVPENRVVLDRAGMPQMDYTLAPESIEALCHAQAQSARIFLAAGCEKVVMPCADKMLFSRDDVADDRLENFISAKNYVPNKMPLSSAHPQGGCRMGRNAADSVTDDRGQVHGKPWLYVADGSLFPKSSHVNPYLTIMALADRVAERLRETAREWS